MDKEVIEQRTPSSLRHTHTHFAPLQDSRSIETLAKQVDTSAEIIEQNQSQSTPALKPDLIAGPSMGKQKAEHGQG